MSLEGGEAHFNQTLKLAVSMYFDTVKNKFVEKKVDIDKGSVCTVL